jgi:hypothetical protein
MPLALKVKEARERDQSKALGRLKCVIDARMSHKSLTEKALLRWQERYKAKIAQKAIAFVFHSTRPLILIDITF